MRSINRIAWMWEEALEALERAERRRRQYFGLLAVTAPQPAWEPPADVLESEREVLVTVALPGVRPETVRVEITPSGLLVSAERVPSACLERMRVSRLEIPYGRFERRIDLADGRYVLLESRLADGCLELRLARE